MKHSEIWKISELISSKCSISKLHLNIFYVYNEYVNVWEVKIIPMIKMILKFKFITKKLSFRYNLLLKKVYLISICNLNDKKWLSTYYLLRFFQSLNWIVYWLILPRLQTKSETTNNQSFCKYCARHLSLSSTLQSHLH